MEFAAAEQSRSISDERIFHRQPTFEQLTILQVFRVERVAAGGRRGGDDKRVPIRYLVARLNLHGCASNGLIEGDDATALQQVGSNAMARDHVEPEFAPGDIMKLVDDLRADHW